MSFNATQRILGLAELINTQPLEPGQTQHLQLLQRSGERLLRLVNDVLDMSRAEAGAVPVVKNVSIFLRSSMI